MLMVAGADHIGELQAWNVDTGKRVWTTKLAKSQNWGPMLATAGDVLFSAAAPTIACSAPSMPTPENSCGNFRPCPASSAPPVSFAVDGKQYIAVQSGWGVDSARMQGRLNPLFPGKYPDVPEGGAIYVFALK